MPQLSPALGTLKMLGLPQTQAQAASAPAKSGHAGFSFHDFLSIINPLQHLPVVGTLYRAITGDTIGTPEKIAGDTLYGGLWGAVSSIADAGFEAITGKNIGDTVLALFTGHHDQPTQLADNAVSANATATSPVSQATSPDVAALSTALAQKGVDSDLAARAMFAYQKSMTLPNTVLATVQ